MTAIRVLVVDEDLEVLDLTATFLERQNQALEVVTESSAADAITRFERGTIDAVVSDLRMPDIDGVELATRIAPDGEVPVFLFTGADEHLTRERTDVPAVTDVIRKGTGTDHYESLASAITAAVQR